jgi:hypothetical protein
MELWLSLMYSLSLPAGTILLQRADYGLFPSMRGFDAVLLVTMFIAI